MWPFLSSQSLGWDLISVWATGLTLLTVLDNLVSLFYFCDFMRVELQCVVQPNVLYNRWKISLSLWICVNYNLRKKCFCISMCRALQGITEQQKTTPTAALIDLNGWKFSKETHTRPIWCLTSWNTPATIRIHRLTPAIKRYKWIKGRWKHNGPPQPMGNSYQNEKAITALSTDTQSAAAKWNSSTWLSSYFTLLMRGQEILFSSALSIRIIIS